MRLRTKLNLGFYEQILARIPYGFGVRVRKRYFQNRMGYYGKGVRISHKVKILEPNNIQLNDYVRLANNSILTGQNGIEIGKFSMIGFESIILSSTHAFDNKGVPYMYQGNKGQKVVIGSNVWIGTRVIILPGVKIGKNSIIGAGSVVTNNIPSNSIAGGNPAKVIRNVE